MEFLSEFLRYNNIITTSTVIMIIPLLIKVLGIYYFPHLHATIYTYEYIPHA